MKIRSMRTQAVSVLALLVAVVGLVACGQSAEQGTGDQVSVGEPGAAASASAETSPRGATGQTRVYFAWNEKIGTAGRPDAAATPEAALQALLDGPDSFEREIGMNSQIPEATELLGVSVADGTAVVDLAQAFETGGGSLSMELRVAQVVFTATQFDEVDDVTIHLDGAAVAGIGGEGVPATEVARSDFPNVTPAILIESPTPGASVASPLTVSGMSNTFEGTVNYSIVDGDGLIVAEGFTTATAGNGTWGTFEFTETFSGAKPGLGAVIAFQLDAEDGGQRDVYDVPVRFGEAAPPSSPDDPGSQASSADDPAAGPEPSAAAPQPAAPVEFTG